ncbi:MAG: DUF2309 domain-containing protein [Methylotenera sp.]|nr:DUF2309 domain-containing protein [Methylotenera sp.]
MIKQTFDEQRVLHKLSHYLPTQAPLKEFIHHNSLHALQNMRFYDAIFKGSKIFGFQATMALTDFRHLYQVGRVRDDVLNKVIVDAKGVEQLSLWKNKLQAGAYDEHNAERIGQLRNAWKAKLGLDLDNLVQPQIFRLLSSYLDQGIAIWSFPVGHLGFLDNIKFLEKTSLVSLFKTQKAKELLLKKELSITSLLTILVGKPDYFEQYLFDQQFSHRGWSGMVATVEARPDTLLDAKKISLQDLIILECLFEIDNLEASLGAGWQPLSAHIDAPPMDLFADITETELNQVFQLWQDAFEWSYYDTVLKGLQQQSMVVNARRPVKTLARDGPSFQAFFCIDERECSIRRHIENVAPDCETFGTPGFFSTEFFFLAQGAKFYDKLCPAPVTPKFLIKESNVPTMRGHDRFYTPKAHGLATGFIISLTFGFWAAVRLVQNLFFPSMSPAISNAFSVMHPVGDLTVENKHPSDKVGDLQIGFTVDEMTSRVASLLSSVGLTQKFSNIVYLIAHGSSSANNPHHGAHDCGACSGRPGAVNARVFAQMANHEKVRTQLQKQGINIPETTQFVGGLHDTAAEEIAFYDIDKLNVQNQVAHVHYVQSFENALDLNARERSRRFASINTHAPINDIRLAIKARSVSLFEPRPELGHGSNALCIVGKRSLTRGLFLDRRAFLNSYDYQADPEGQFLAGIMKPLGPVCGGINLEYYFSRVDNYKMGAGTKLPHNVVGLFGVANSSDGDLRPGLPWQMVEVHDPIRLMVIVEHFPEIVLKAIKSTPEMYEWFINEWVHLSVIHPETYALYYFKAGAFAPYLPLADALDTHDSHRLIAIAKPMFNNHIAHATQENLPVHISQ